MEVTERAPIGVGVIGLGFMGRTHLAAYRDAAADGFPCRIAAVCDRKPGVAAAPSRAGNLQIDDGARPLFDVATVRRYEDADALLRDPSVELVSICTPTDTHVDLVLRALAAGKHVLVEKPLALDPADCDRAVAAAARSGRVCMPAFCMRFWPGWEWLRDRVADGSFGAVRSAVFQRLSSPPDWSPHFYQNAALTGGALADLHIHDADFVRWCFGDPDGVECAGSIDHVTATYRFARGPAHVVAEGGWDHAPGYGFRMRYTVVFERATAEYDLSRPEPLMLFRGGAAERVPLPPGTGYDGEVRHVLRAISEGGSPRAALADAAAVARLLARERAKLNSSPPGPRS